jgi:hypothetical protein
MECDLVSDETLHGDDTFNESSSSDLSSYPSEVYVPHDGTTQDLMEAIRQVFELPMHLPVGTLTPLHLCSSAKGQELEISPDNDYLHRHGHTVLQNDYITARMRNITAGWMVEVANHFQLQPETLFLAINLLDRYLSRSHVSIPVAATLVCLLQCLGCRHLTRRTARALVLYACPVAALGQRWSTP